MTETLEVSLWRGGADGRYQAYQVPLRENQTVLDVVTWVQRNADPTLSYRFACRVGMCGSCAMTVNGRPRWTCRTHVSKVAADGRLEIGPLANLPVIKDLAADMRAVLREVAAGQGRVRAVARRAPMPIEQIRPDSAARIAADAAIECINCGVCYAACDTVRWNEDYLGPAALNRAWTLVNDVRDAGNSRAACGGRGRPAAATPATRTSPARSTARRRSTRPPPSPASSGAPCRPISRARSAMNVRLYILQRATAAIMVPLVLVHLVVIFYATAPGPDRRRHSGAHARQHRLGARSTACSCWRRPCTAPSACARSLTEWTPLDERRAGDVADVAFGVVLLRARAAGGGRGGAAMTRAAPAAIARSALWIAALVHRLSGLALACFLPLHFLALGLAIDGEARLDGFLRWTRPAAGEARGDGARVPAGGAHAGRPALLVIENLPWRDGQKQLATGARCRCRRDRAFVFLARVF